MGNKAFLRLVIGTLVVGVGLGVAVIGVVALGNSNGEETIQSNLPTRTTSGAGAGAQTNQQSADEPTQEIQPEVASQEELAQDQRQNRGQFSQALGGGRIVTGTIEKIEENTLTVNTPQGQLLTSIGKDTIIQIFGEVALSDLATGIRATVVGQREEDGTVAARSVSILPEGTDGLLGGGFADRLGQDLDGQEQLNQLRQRIQSGEITQEELAELRQQFQGQSGQGAPGRPGQFGQGGPGGRGFGGGGGLTGTIEKIEDNTITINTPQGPLAAIVGEETVIQMLVQGTLADLETDAQVNIIGRLTEDESTIEATSVFIVRGGADGIFGSGFPGGRGLPSGEENR